MNSLRFTLLIACLQGFVLACGGTYGPDVTTGTDDPSDGMLSDGLVDGGASDGRVIERDGDLVADGGLFDGATTDGGMSPFDSATTDGGMNPDGALQDDASTDQGMGPAQARLRLTVTPPLTGLAAQGKSVALRCSYLSADGTVLDPPADLVVGFDVPEGERIEGRWQFSDYGVYTAHCRSESLALEAEDQVIVQFDGVDHRFTDHIDALYEAAPLYRRLVLSFVTGDAAGVNEALAVLRSIEDRFTDLGEVEWIAEHPLQSWPGAAELDAAGLMADDADNEWLNALAAFDARVVEHQAFWSELNPAQLDEARIDEVQAQMRAMQRAAERIANLPVSARTAWLERSRLGTVNRRLLETAVLMHRTLLNYYSGPIPDPVDNGFVGADLLSTLVVQSTLVAAEEAFEEVSYTRMLRDVGITAAASLAQIGIRQILNLNLEVPDDAIRIDSIHGPAAGFMGAGNPFYGVGHFPRPLETNQLLIVPPRYTQFIDNIVDALESIESIWESQKIVMKAQEVQRVINAILRLMVAADDLGGIERFAEFIGIRPIDGGSELVYFPNLPTGLNCSRFMLPAAGTVIPINLNTGKGLAVNVNFYGERAGACE